jgi:hypothetical protein
MKPAIRRFVVFTGIAMAAGIHTQAQTVSPIVRSLPAFDLIVTYNAVHAQSYGESGFFMQGAGVELYRKVVTNVGVVADATESRAGSTPSTAGLDLLTVSAGPRITTSRREGLLDFYMQGLAGRAMGSHSVFPCSTGTCTHASGLEIQLGYGVDYHIQDGLMLRLVQGDWMYTRLPNGGADAENNFRLSTGLVLRFH